MTRLIRRLPRSSVRSPFLVSIVPLILLATQSGCWIPYAISAGLGELGVLLGARPITEVLQSDDLDPDTETKLQFVLDVREYAIDVLGLNGGNAYSTFYDSEGEDVLHNISASRRDRFEPMVWSFPIVGSFEYIGFFDGGQAERYAERLEDAGWDVFMYPPGGYSTIGWLPDPLFSAALSRDLIDLADLVIHEFTHNTAYKMSDSVFNESLATFVGRTGALAFFAQWDGSNGDALAAAQARWADADLYTQFWTELYLELNDHYNRTDLTSAEKIAGREDIFAASKERFVDEYLPAFNEPDRYGGLPDVPFDNAYVLIHRRYNLDLDLFQDVCDALDQDLAAAIRVFTDSADADDPKQYLRDWLAAR